MWCRRHCWVWALVDLPGAGCLCVANVCAHCPAERRRWDPVDLAGDLDRVRLSTLAHGASGCLRAARLPMPLAQDA